MAQTRHRTPDHGPQIKDDRQYERLREQGYSKEKSARIANTPRRTAGKRGGSLALSEIETNALDDAA